MKQASLPLSSLCQSAMEARVTKLEQEVGKAITLLQKLIARQRPATPPTLASNATPVPPDPVAWYRITVTPPPDPLPHFLNRIATSNAVHADKLSAVTYFDPPDDTPVLELLIRMNCRCLQTHLLHRWAAECTQGSIDIRPPPPSIRCRKMLSYKLLCNVYLEHQEREGPRTGDTLTSAYIRERIVDFK